VGEETLAGFVFVHPVAQHRLLDASHRFAFGDARVGHAVHVALEQRLLILSGQMPVVGHALVGVVRDEVEDVFLEVCAGATDRVHLVPADHLGQGKAELGCRHRPRQCDEHRPAAFEMFDVIVGCGAKCCRVEMPVMVLDELSDRAASSGAEYTLV